VGLRSESHSTLRWTASAFPSLAFDFILVRRSSIGEAVAAQITRNALVAAGVLAAGMYPIPVK
jgi:hypothetical protein